MLKNHFVAYPPPPTPQIQTLIARCQAERHLIVLLNFWVWPNCGLDYLEKNVNNLECKPVIFLHSIINLTYRNRLLSSKKALSVETFVYLEITNSPNTKKSILKSKCFLICMKFNMLSSRDKALISILSPV